MGRRGAPRVVRRRRHDLHARTARDDALGVLLSATRLVGVLGPIGLVGLLGLLAAAAPAPTPKLLEAGRQVYDVQCAACHGVTGEGNGPVAFAVKPPPRNLVREPFKAGDRVEQIYQTITSGLPNTRMVGYPQIKEIDRWAVAYYVRAFRLKK